MSKPIYLDYAAATPLDERVFNTMRPYFNEKFYNPSAGYLAAKEVSRAIQSARRGVAKWLGARPSEIVFTAGGTEANNLALQGVMQAFPGKKVVVSAIEHESVLKPAQRFNHSFAPVLPDGRINIDALKRAITPETVLVSVMYANNEVGTVQPIAMVAKLVRIERAKRAKRGSKLPIYLHTDACQAPLYLDLHVSRLGVDLMTINGGKIYGPKQSGALFIKSNTKLVPQILGGGQEASRRSGTENVPAIVGLSAALELAQAQYKTEAKRLAGLQELFFAEIKKHLPKVVVNGSWRYRLPNNVHLTLTGRDNERVMMELDQRGIQCGVGSACSASSEEPSHVLTAMGINGKDAQSSLRFTMGRSTDEAAVRRTIKQLIDFV